MESLLGILFAAICAFLILISVLEWPVKIRSSSYRGLIYLLALLFILGSAFYIYYVVLIAVYFGVVALGLILRSLQNRANVPRA